MELMEVESVDLLEMLLAAAETNTEVLGVNYPSTKACKLWRITYTKIKKVRLIK